MKRVAILSAAALLLTGGAAFGAITAPRTVSPAVSAPAPTATPTATAAPTFDCASLKPGDAWAGVSLVCPPTASPTATATATSTATPAPVATIQPVPIATSSTGPVIAVPVPAPVKSTPAPHKEEDDPGWDCYKDGNLICGPTSPAQQAEAWNNFDTRGFTEAELSRPFRVTYRGTTKTPNDLAWDHEWYTLPSSTPGLDHVFEIEFGVTK